MSCMRACLECHVLPSARMQLLDQVPVVRHTILLQSSMRARRHNQLCACAASSPSVLMNHCKSSLLPGMCFSLLAGGMDSSVYRYPNMMCQHAANQLPSHQPHGLVIASTRTQAGLCKPHLFSTTKENNEHDLSCCALVDYKLDLVRNVGCIESDTLACNSCMKYAVCLCEDLLKLDLSVSSSCYASTYCIV